MERLKRQLHVVHSRQFTQTHTAHTAHFALMLKSSHIHRISGGPPQLWTDEYQAAMLSLIKF